MSPRVFKRLAARYGAETCYQKSGDGKWIRRTEVHFPGGMALSEVTGPPRKTRLEIIGVHWTAPEARRRAIE